MTIIDMVKINGVWQAPGEPLPYKRSAPQQPAPQRRGKGRGGGGKFEFAYDLNDPDQLSAYLSDFQRSNFHR